MHKNLIIAAVVLATALPVMAQDAEAGKEYDITIQSEEDSQWTGPFGRAMVGKVVFAVPNAKKAEKYHVKVTAIKQHQYTGDTQASCEFQQAGGDRKGTCIAAP
jgi:hypothetical protein